MAIADGAVGAGAHAAGHGAARGATVAPGVLTGPLPAAGMPLADAALSLPGCVVDGEYLLACGSAGRAAQATKLT